MLRERVQEWRRQINSDGEPVVERMLLRAVLGFYADQLPEEYDRRIEEADEETVMAWMHAAEEASSFEEVFQAKRKPEPELESFAPLAKLSDAERQLYEQTRPFIDSAVKWGYDKGFDEGLHAGLRVAVDLGLNARFGDMGNDFAARLRWTADLDCIEKVTRLLREGATLEEIAATVDDDMLSGPA